MERFATKVNGFKLLTTVATFPIADVCGSPGHASDKQLIDAFISRS